MVYRIDEEARRSSESKIMKNFTWNLRNGNWRGPELLEEMGSYELIGKVEKCEPIKIIGCKSVGLIPKESRAVKENRAIYI